MVKFTGKILLVALGALVVLEAALRIYFYPVFDFSRVSEFDPYQWVRLKPGADKLITNKIHLSLFSRSIKFRYPIKVNSQSLRADKDFETNPAEPIFRVICLGDSVTFGWNLENQYSYPALLEQELNRQDPSRHAQVINAGYPSYTSRQGLIWMDRELLELHPQLVLVQFGFNDALPSWLRMSGPIYLKPDQEVMAGTPGHWHPLKVSAFRHLTDLLVSRTIVGKLPLFFYGMMGTHSRVPRKDFEGNLNTIRRLCEAHNARLILIESWGTPPEYLDAVRQFAKAKNLEVFSQAEVMEKSFLRLKEILDQDRYRPYLDQVHARFSSEFLEKNRQFYLGVDWLHPNELGNFLVAEKLAEFILQGKDGD